MGLMCFAVIFKPSSKQGWTKRHQSQDLDPGSDQLCHAEDRKNQVLLAHTGNKAQSGKAGRKRRAYIDEEGPQQRDQVTPR